APFASSPHMAIEVDGRFAGVQWGNDTIALVHSRRGTRARVHVIDPSGAEAPRLLWERSTEDRYADPGVPVTVTNAAGYPVLRLGEDGASFHLTGSGATPRGSYPFLDRVDLCTGATERLWQAQDPRYEAVVAVLD